MATNSNRLKTQIDFSVTRFTRSANLIYTALMRHNRSVNHGISASALLVKAYANYDASELDAVTGYIDFKNTIFSFINRYNVSCKADIKHLIKTASVIGDTELLEPKKKFFDFDGNDPAVKSLWDAINIIRFRDRGPVLNKFLFQYFAHGNSEHYNALCADLMFEWMKDEDLLIASIDSTRLDTFIDQICLLGGIEDKDTPAVDDSVIDPDISDQDRLRKAMGLI